MRWVLGTGRCGMQNYTTWKQGFIHSDQKLREIAVRKYQGEMSQEDYEYARSIFIERSQMPFPSIADCCQFMFIDLISFIDSNAKFVWLVREREACIRSFMDRGAEEQRIHKKGTEFSYEGKPARIASYIDEVNRIISEGLRGRDFEMILTESMPLLVAQ